LPAGVLSHRTVLAPADVAGARALPCRRRPPLGPGGLLDNDDCDRERVRQIVRRLTDTADGPTATAATGDWLGETERQRSVS
jgi:hypothetical protein